MALTRDTWSLIHKAHLSFLCQFLGIFSYDIHTMLWSSIIVFIFECPAWIKMVNVKHINLLKNTSQCVILRSEILQNIRSFLKWALWMMHKYFRVLIHQIIVLLIPSQNKTSIICLVGIILQSTSSFEVLKFKNKETSNIYPWDAYVTNFIWLLGQKIVVPKSSSSGWCFYNVYFFCVSFWCLESKRQLIDGKRVNIWDLLWCHVEN
jgi:hypothetical protein